MVEDILQNQDGVISVKASAIRVLLSDVICSRMTFINGLSFREDSTPVSSSKIFHAKRS